MSRLTFEIYCSTQKLEAETAQLFMDCSPVFTVFTVYGGQTLYALFLFLSGVSGLFVVNSVKYTKLRIFGQIALYVCTHNISQNAFFIHYKKTLCLVSCCHLTQKIKSVNSQVNWDNTALAYLSNICSQLTNHT